MIEFAALKASLCEGGVPQGRRERALPLSEALAIRLSPPPAAAGAPSQRGPKRWAANQKMRHNMALDFLILYEHTVREYESDLLLKLELERRG